MKRAFFSLFLLLPLALCAGNIAQNGTADLRDQRALGHLSLHGQWHFYPGLWPEAITDEIAPLTLTVPARWDEHTIGSMGHGTYRLALKLPAPGLYTLKVDNALSAYALWIDDQLLGGAGEVSTTEASARPSYARKSFTFYSEGSSTLFIAVSNFHHRSGGLADAVHIGTPEAMQSRERLLISRDLFLIGALLIMALYHFGLFLLRPRDRIALLFSLFSLAFVLRQLSTGERFMLDLFSEIPWSWLVRIEYASGYIALPLFITFIAWLYPARSHPLLVRAFQVVSAIFLAITLFTPPRIFTQSREFFELLVVSFILYTLYILIRSALAKEAGAKVALGGFMVLAVAVGHDILYMRGLTFYFGDLIPAGFFVFMLAWSFLLAQRYARAFETIDQQRRTLEEYQRQLENRVQERTRALARSLQDKETLLKEIYHRVKNNLQLIVSLIGLKMRHLHHPLAREALEEIEGRIKSIALVHERLYQEGSGGTLELDEYIRAIAAQLANLHAHQVAHFEIGGDRIELGLDQAVPLGLIVNELITNSLKYAFKESSGTIRIQLHQKKGRFMLRYTDDGIGFNPQKQEAQTPTLGLRMIPSLCRQMEGRYRWLSPERGMGFEIEAPLTEKEGRDG